jgi:NTP pyrophosphatase (non-canonical NTP hydrolase)
MIYCKDECVFSEHGVCIKEDVLIGVCGCLSKANHKNSVYRIVLDKYGKKAQAKKARQELDELKYELTECIINDKLYDFKWDYGAKEIIEEIADVLNMIESLKLIFNIGNEDLHNHMVEKMRRTTERIQKERVVDIGRISDCKNR